MAKSIAPWNGGTTHIQMDGGGYAFGRIGPIAEGTLIRRLDVTINVMSPVVNGGIFWGVMLTVSDELSVENFQTGRLLTTDGFSFLGRDSGMIASQAVCGGTNFRLNLGVRVDDGPRFMLIAMYHGSVGKNVFGFFSAEFYGMVDIDPRASGFAARRAAAGSAGVLDVLRDAARNGSAGTL